MMQDPTRPIRFANSWLREARHVCAFFNSSEEKYRVLLPFIKEGLECGHKAFHIVNEDCHLDHSRRMDAVGINTSAAQRSGQLEIRSDTQTYLQQGLFNPDQMLTMFEQLASGGTSGAYPLTRFICHMDWATEGSSRIDELIEFECRANDVWRRHHDVVICTYDLAKVSGNTVIDILRTHPMVIIGGFLQQNPFFMQPEDFLQVLRARRGHRDSHEI
jgi:hypothetical protein